MRHTLTFLMTAALAAFGCGEESSGGEAGDQGVADMGGAGGAGGAGQGGMGGGAGGAGGEGGEGGAGGGAVDGSTLRGRLDVDGGNQSTRTARSKQSAGIDADAVSIVTATGEVLAEAAVEADGRFEITGLNAIEAPFMVEASLDGAVVGRVLVPVDLEQDDEMAVMPISRETSVEAMVFAGLEASGEAIDGIGLVTHISQEMAADDDAALDSAVVAAQAAFIAALDARSEDDVDVEALLDARSAAFVTLSSALDAASDAEAEAAAWDEWFIAERAALELAFQVDQSAQSEARAAASLSLAIEAEANAGEPAEQHAALQLATMLSGRAHQAALETLITGEAELEATVSAAFEAFFEDTRDADDLDGLVAAEANLRAALIGAGGLADYLRANLDARTGLGVQAVIGARAGLESTARDVFDFADGEGAQLGEAVAAGHAEVQAHVDALVRGQLGGANGEASGALLGELMIHAVANPAEQLAGDVEMGALVEGTLTADAPACDAGAFMCGARSIVADLDATLRGIGRFETAEGARLVVRDGNRTLAAVAGVAGEGGFDIELPSGEQPDGMTTIEILSAGEVIGALLVERPAVDDGEARQLRPITIESSVEALIASTLADRGEPVDRSVIERLIDAAVARASLESEQQFDATLTAIAVAQAVQSATLDLPVDQMDSAGAEARAALEAALEGGNDDAGDAFARFYGEIQAALTGDDAERWAWVMAQTAAAFELAVRAQGEAGSMLAVTSKARAQIEAAIAGTWAMQDRIDDASMPLAIDATLDEALVLLVEQTNDADNADDVELAGEDFAAGLTGSSGLLYDMSAAIADGDLVLATTLDTALAVSVQAAEAGEANLAAALEAALSAHSAGGANSEAMASTLAAFEAFEIFLASAFDNPVFSELDSADFDALATVTSMTSLGLFGSF